MERGLCIGMTKKYTSKLATFLTAIAITDKTVVSTVMERRRVITTNVPLEVHVNNNLLITNTFYRAIQGYPKSILSVQNVLPSI